MACLSTWALRAEGGTSSYDDWLDSIYHEASCGLPGRVNNSIPGKGLLCPFPCRTERLRKQLTMVLANTEGLARPDAPDNIFLWLGDLPKAQLDEQAG